jgi:hypothetical protein
MNRPAPSLRLRRILWAAVLVALPVTNFRYFPLLGATTTVRPLSAYPLALLLIVLGWRWWRRREPFPWRNALWPLCLFLLAWGVSTAFGAWLDPLPLRGQDYLDRALRAWVSLALGLAFFLATIWMNQDEQAIRFTLRWLMVGLLANLLWSLVQMIAFYTPWLSISTLREWQFSFSMRAPLQLRRVSGLTMEPSWLGAQMFTLYLPWFFAALFERFSITGRRSWDALLGTLSVIVLLASYSRSGILITALTFVLALGLTARAYLLQKWRWFWQGFRQGGRTFVLRLLLLLIVALLLSGAFLFLARHPYFAALWNAPADDWRQYLVKIYAGPRAAYAISALAVWERSPLLGVGAGGAGFSMYRALPDWVLTFVPEISKHLTPTSNLFPNPKNLYVRLLTESGLLGFVLFFLFWLHLLADTLSLMRFSQTARALARAALFFFIATAFYHFTQDSLAQPDLWLIPGMVAGLLPPPQPQPQARPENAR